MKLLCLIDHTYQDTHFEAGQVYEVEDGAASRLLRDYGPGDTDEARRGRAPKFEAAAPDAEVTPPEGEVAPYEAPDLSGMTRAQLETFAAENGLTANSALTVADLRADLQAQLEARQTEAAP